MSIIELSPQKQFGLLTKVSTIAGAIGTRKLIQTAWKGMTKKEPPQNPASPGVVWKEALLWGAFSGLTVGIIKVVMRRTTTAYWKKYNGTKGLKA